VKQRRQELKSIRQESENVQAYLKGRLHELSNTCEWEGLDYYTRELEKLKDCVSDRESAKQLQGELRRREAESEELRRTVSRLEQTVLDLGGSVTLGEMEVETGKKQDNSLCASSCQLF
jgi:putative IMPACT (imprinted ancient) family translation regulator